MRKLAGSPHAPADWKFHAQMIVESWAGKTPQEIAATLSCHPRTVRIHLNRFDAEGVNGLGMREGAGRKPRLSARAQQDSGPGEAISSWEVGAVCGNARGSR